MNGHKSSRKPRKTLQIVKDKRFPSMLRLQFKEGGNVPKNLSGMYGKEAEAQQAIDYYVEGYTRDKIRPSAPKNDIPQRKVKKDAKTEDAGRV